MRALNVIVAVSLLSATLAAQSQFIVECTGDQENPPVASAGVGLGYLTLDGSGALAYDIRHDRLDATAAHIHIGAVGVNGSVVFSLTKVGPGHRQGITPVLTPTQLADLRAGNYYVNIHTPAHGGGELRGQVLIHALEGRVELDDEQVVGGGNPVASGSGPVSVIDLSGSHQVWPVVSHTVVNPTGLNLYAGAPGVNGTLIATVPTENGPGLYATSMVVDEDEYALFQEGGLYVEITSAAFPAGEVRGQLLPSGLHPLSGVDGFDLELTHAGAPMDGVENTLAIAGGTPATPCFVIGSLDLAMTPVADRLVLIDVSTLMFGAQLVLLDGLGEASLSRVVADISSDATIYFQAFNVHAGAANGLFEASNLVEMRLQNVK